jgi:hypothetical protein
MASALALVGSIPATAASAGVTGTKWDTISGWDGSSYVQPFGNPDTATYGQWFTAPDGVKKIKKWTFNMGANAGTGTLVMTGGLYTWDGTKAVTKVWESKELSVDLTQGDPTVHKVTLKPKKKGKVKPGQNYVMFLSVSKTYEETAPNVLSQWAANYTDVLPNSDVVFLNNGGDESQWTTMQWTTFTGFDFAFKAKFK